MTDITKMKVKELKAECKKRGIKGYSKLRKQQLIDLLNKHQEEEEADCMRCGLSWKDSESLDICKDCGENVSCAECRDEYNSVETNHIDVCDDCGKSVCLNCKKENHENCEGEEEEEEKEEEEEDTLTFRESIDCGWYREMISLKNNSKRDQEIFLKVARDFQALYLKEKDTLYKSKRHHAHWFYRVFVELPLEQVKELPEEICKKCGDKEDEIVQGLCEKCEIKKQIEEIYGKKKD